MGLASNLFKNDPLLQSCLTNDASHLVVGTIGPHVGKVQLGELHDLPLQSRSRGAIRYTNSPSPAS